MILAEMKAPSLYTPNILLQDETVLEQLERVTRWSDDFSLVFVKCNAPFQRRVLSQSLGERLSDKTLLEIELDKPIISLLEEIEARLEKVAMPDAVCIYGLENSINQ